MSNRGEFDPRCLRDLLTGETFFSVDYWVSPLYLNGQGSPSESFWIVPGTYQESRQSFSMIDIKDQYNRDKILRSI